MKWFFLFTFVTVLGLYIEVQYQEYLEDLGAEMIMLLQRFRSHSMDIVFEILEVITGVLFLMVSALLFMSGFAEIGLLGLYSGFLGVALSGVAKMWLHHPRPFWKYDPIHIVSCSYDWGSPSGHGAAGGGSMIILLSFWVKNKKHVNAKIFLINFCNFITAIDRLYLGVHFFFQVILGFLFGITAGIGTLQDFFAPKFFNVRNDKKFLMREHVKMAIFSLFSAAVYVYVKETPMEGVWVKNYAEKCGKNLVAGEAMAKDLAEALYVWIPLGALFGFYSMKQVHKPKVHFMTLVFNVLYLGIIFGAIAGLDKLFLVKFPQGIKFLCIIATRYLAGFIIGKYSHSITIKIFGENFNIKNS